jgi:glutaredoxin 3
MDTKKNIKKKQNFQIDLYVRKHCGFCAHLINFLDDNNIKYSKQCLDKDFDRQGFYQQFGKDATFPRVLVNQKCIGGCVETIKLLSRQ